MSAQTLLKRIVDELKAGEQFVFALAVQRIGERLIVDDTADDAVDLGSLPMSREWNSPTIKVRAA